MSRMAPCVCGEGKPGNVVVCGPEGDDALGVSHAAPTLRQPFLVVPTQGFGVHDPVRRAHAASPTQRAACCTPGGMAEMDAVGDD